MTELTTTLTINNTDYKITIDTNEDTITHTDHVHYNEGFDVYMFISYKTRGDEVLDHTVHQIGTEPTLTEIPEDSINHDRIRETIQDELNYTLTDEQLTTLTDAYRNAGPQNVDSWGLKQVELYRHMTSDGYISTDIEVPLEGWDYVTSDILDDLDAHPDDERDIIHTIFNALVDNSPGENDYVAQLQCGDIGAWQVRALELYQNSVLANKPQLCKVHALRETGHRPSEISNILDTHRSTISHQLTDIDNWFETADWTTQNVTSD